MRSGKQRPAWAPFAGRNGESDEGTEKPAAAGRRPQGTWQRLRARLAGTAEALDATQKREFSQALDRTLSDALPGLGIVFGAGVLLFSAWDYWIAPQQAADSVLVRLALVLVGAAGYLRWSERVPVAWRCALVYVTHTGAMILSSALLPDGLLLALPAITGVMFPLALIEPRLQRLGALVLVPSALFLALGAVVLPRREFAGSALVYLLMLGLVVAVALFQGRLLLREFLAERALAWSARHDSLCGVLARGYLLELAGHDVALARRYRHPLAVGMLDIDHFKRVNDTWGHAVGDALLQAVSMACSEQLRASDYFGRYGGEEFVCVMPETGQDEALACAERMRTAVAAVRVSTASGAVQCTISIGVAVLAPWHADVADLIAAADAALYQAKSGGRNRVELASQQGTGNAYET